MRKIADLAPGDRVVIQIDSKFEFSDVIITLEFQGPNPRDVEASCAGSIGAGSAKRSMSVSEEQVSRIDSLIENSRAAPRGDPLVLGNSFEILAEWFSHGELVDQEAFSNPPGLSGAQLGFMLSLVRKVVGVCQDGGAV